MLRASQLDLRVAEVENQKMTQYEQLEHKLRDVGARIAALERHIEVMIDERIGSTLERRILRELAGFGNEAGGVERVPRNGHAAPAHEQHLENECELEEEASEEETFERSGGEEPCNRATLATHLGEESVEEAEMKSLAGASRARLVERTSTTAQCCGPRFGDRHGRRHRGVDFDGVLHELHLGDVGMIMSVLGDGWHHRRGPVVGFDSTRRTTPF